MALLWHLHSKERTTKLDLRFCQRKRKFSQNDSLLQRRVSAVSIVKTWIKLLHPALCSLTLASAKTQTTRLNLLLKSLLVPMMSPWEKEMLKLSCRWMCSTPNLPTLNLLRMLKWHLLTRGRPPTAPQLSLLSRKVDSKTGSFLSKVTVNK